MADAQEIAVHFYVPYAGGPVQSAKVWEAVRASLAAHGVPTRPVRIWKLSYRHDGKAYADQIGQEHADLGEEVLVILQGQDAPFFYICTANRGVASGEPYVVDANDEALAIEFDDAADW